MGLGRCRTRACSRSFNWWRNRGVILRLRVRLSVLRLWLRLSRLRLWLRLCPYATYGYGYPAYGYGYGTGYYGGYRAAYHPIRRHIYAYHPVRRHWRY